MGLFVTGDFISIDLRGCQMPTPRPRPHIPVLYREGGFTPPELYDAIEAADAGCIRGTSACCRGASASRWASGRRMSRRGARSWSARELRRDRGVHGVPAPLVP